MKTNTDTFKRKINQLEREIKKRQEQIDENLGNILELDQSNKMLLEDREKLKERILKLKSRRGRFDLATKICNNCKKDYKDNENFNWSCRTHQS